MKKLIIGAIVGSLILFIWQFLSWAMLDLHGSQMEYTSQQDAILEALASAELEEGDYFVPRAPRGAPDEEAQAVMVANEGKPWALIQYRKSMTNQMGMNMFRAWAIALVSVLFLAWLLAQFAELNLKKAVMAAISVGIIGYLTIPYLNSVWFEGNTMPDLIDAIVPWAVVGCWLGWWMNRD